eukprot:355350-Pyramimonas_sp.AAC.1
MQKALGFRHWLDQKVGNKCSPTDFMLHVKNYPRYDGARWVTQGGRVLGHCIEEFVPPFIVGDAVLEVALHFANSAP